jgi:3-hydroxyacyl-CoA dehydrogenase / enoyl-CoA hydratase / 3-hydroxybutyryl-CoA epimerase
LSGQAAVDAGLVHALVPDGDEIAAAEAWLLDAGAPQQPWDRKGQAVLRADAITAALGPVRARMMADTQGRYPAPVAILDCIEYGLPQCFDGAIRSEMAIFAHLIQRPEPRNMIQTLFLGKTDHDRLARKQMVPPLIADVVEVIRPLTGDFADPAVLARIDAAISPWIGGHTPEELRMADYAIVATLGYPAFLGGPFTFRTRGWG